MSRLFDDASTEYLTLNTPALNAFPLTLAAWVYVDDLTVNGAVVGLYDKNASNNWLRLNIEAAGNNLLAQILVTSGTNVNAFTLTTLSENTWHHVFGRFTDEGGGVLANAALLDGGGKATDSETAGQSPGSWDRTRIGYTGDSTAIHPFSGRIAEVAIWNVALSDAEAVILANGFSPLFVQPSNIVSYWPLIRDDDQDRVGDINLNATSTPSIAEHPPKMIYPAPPFISYPVAAVGNAMPMAMDHYRRRRVAA